MAHRVGARLQDSCDAVFRRATALLQAIDTSGNRRRGGEKRQEHEEEPYPSGARREANTDRTDGDPHRTENRDGRLMFLKKIVETLHEGCRNDRRFCASMKACPRLIVELSVNR